jgi:hypothetical protein
MIYRIIENKYRVTKSVCILFYVFTIKPGMQPNIYFIDVNQKANTPLYVIKL